MDKYHIPVLLQEVLKYLDVRKDALYIDATLGGGGHSFEILQLGGRVLGLDVDQEALEHVEEKFKIQSSPPEADQPLAEKIKIDEDIILRRCNFREIGKIARENGFEKVSGVLMDLGVSSHQLDTAERGFSFGKTGPLDMRMDRELTVSARELINGLSKKELKELFERFGEERFAERIASYITKRRQVQPIETTEQLATIIKRAVPFDQSDIHPATRIFQALRIVVNDELHALEEALPQALELLENNGRLVVISFHSLEDRIVKHAFERFEEEKKGVVLTEKPIMPSEEEMEKNRRARSSKLRVFERHL